MVNKTIEQIRQTRLSIQPQSVCKIWHMALFEVNPHTGKATILKSFSRPAKDSVIKNVTKKKKENKQPSIEIKNIDETEDLF